VPCSCPTITGRIISEGGEWQVELRRVKGHADTCIIGTCCLDCPSSAAAPNAALSMTSATTRALIADMAARRVGVTCVVHPNQCAGGRQQRLTTTTGMAGRLCHDLDHNKGDC
jgi:hypothetical protein